MCVCVCVCECVLMVLCDWVCNNNMCLCVSCGDSLHTWLLLLFVCVCAGRWYRWMILIIMWSVYMCIINYCVCVGVGFAFVLRFTDFSGPEWGMVHIPCEKGLFCTCMWTIVNEGSVIFTLIILNSDSKMHRIVQFYVLKCTTLLGILGVGHFLCGLTSDTNWHAMYVN